MHWPDTDSMQSLEGDSWKMTTFSSPAWPRLEIEVSVSKKEDTPPEIEIKKYKPLDPADWALVAAAVKAANELPLPGEQKQPPAGLPSDLGPGAQARIQSLSGPLPSPGPSDPHLHLFRADKAAA